MIKKTIAQLFFALTVISLTACNSTKYYSSTYEYENSNNEVYTELQLMADGTFKEFIFYSLTDSLLQDDFGNLITGTYLLNKDTLLLSYSTNKENNIKENYSYDKKSLKRTKPVTFTLNYENIDFVKGKSIGLRKLPNYHVIKWKTL